ncbi:hypothetical protein AAVH_10142 [Aphelenchoides avenae]|nr:hypothetical protein AAVH_10142 [Aphelenchus avenae]
MMQPSTSSASAAAPDELIQLLQSSSNNPAALHDIISIQNTTGLVAVISSLLSSLELSRTTARKKARYRPALSDDSIIELILFMDRDTLDSMQLVCRFVRDSIATLDRRTAKLALRLIRRVQVGDVMRVGTPVVELMRDEGQPDTLLRYIDNMGPYLRHAYCSSVMIDLQLLPHASGNNADFFYRRFFDGLKAEETPVNSLCLNTRKLASGLLTRCLQAFKSVKKLHHEWVPHCVHDLDVSEATFDAEFFVHAASRGVCDLASITCVTHVWPDEGIVAIPFSAALAFGFAKPESGGDRELFLDHGELTGDLLTQLRQKASELDGSRHISFKFKLIDVRRGGSLMDVNGFEKYYKGDLTWRIDDLENGITVEIEEIEEEVGEFEIVIKVSSPP